jgi:hypothetical protein
MVCMQGAANVFRKLTLITLVGFLVVVLSGPALTLLGVLLPFALVGLLVWIPFRALMLARQGGWSAVRAGARTALRRVFTVPLWILSRVAGGLGWIIRFAFGIVGFVLGLLLPTIAGAILGAVLGIIGGMEHQDAEVRVPAGAAIGATIGLLAGATRSRQPRRIKVIVPRPMPQVAQRPQVTQPVA